MGKRGLRIQGSTTVVEVKAPSGTSWYVEVQPTEMVAPRPLKANDRAPPGTELIGANDRLREAIGGMAGMFEAAAVFASDTLKRHAPAEIEIELNVGFTGTVSPVPFLVGAGAKAAMKVKAKWTRPESK
jgi:hypothetical protein